MKKITSRIFLSYGREDATHAQRLFAELSAYGADVWFDKNQLAAGSQWEATIEKAIHGCRYFITLLSTRSVDRRGFVNREISTALKILDEFP